MSGRQQLKAATAAPGNTDLRERVREEAVSLFRLAIATLPDRLPADAAEPASEPTEADAGA